MFTVEGPVASALVRLRCRLPALTPSPAPTAPTPTTCGSGVTMVAASRVAGGAASASTISTATSFVTPLLQHDMPGPAVSFNEHQLKRRRWCCRRVLPRVASAALAPRFQRRYGWYLGDFMACTITRRAHVPLD